MFSDCEFKGLCKSPGKNASWAHGVSIILSSVKASQLYVTEDTVSERM